MPWKEWSVMDERLRFVARLLEGEAMAAVCREFGISRKTGYRIFDRYKEHGLEALSDRSRRPVRYANQLPAQIESLIVAFKREKPHWGARKLRELLVRRLPGDVRVPAKSTIHAVLYRHGLVRVPGRPRRRATGTPLSPGLAPNDLWCADFKGEFKLGNGQYCCAACRRRSAPTTASPSPARMASSTSQSSPSGGSGSESQSSASGRATRSRTAATSFSTSLSSRKRPARPATTASSSRLASTPSKRSSIPSGPTRPSP